MATSLARSTLDTPVTVLPSVGPGRARRLAKLGIKTLRHLLFFFPLRHEDRSRLTLLKDVQAESIVTVRGIIEKIKNRPGWRNRRLLLTEARLKDSTGKLNVLWFNQPYLPDTLPEGSEVILHGKVSARDGKLVMVSPTAERLRAVTLHTQRIVPVYPQTEGISTPLLRFLIYQALPLTAHLREYLPAHVRRKEKLMGIASAVKNIHFPRSSAALTRARERLSFDELFLLQLAALKRRQQLRNLTAPAFSPPPSPPPLRFPFPLTKAQKRVGEEVLANLARPHPMHRLVSGDVGAGKTVIVALAAARVLAHGWQVALMAPTELLARQHAETLGKFLPSTWKPTLLIGSLKEKEKEFVRKQIRTRKAQLIVGTHALFQEKVHFPRLGLAVIDEQHRFGVRQRVELKQRAGGKWEPHLLSLTATPIPRTLALTVYGDLDLSFIDELPPGRKPVRTELVRPEHRGAMYASVHNILKTGRQGFVVCPRIEENEESERKSVEEVGRRLQEQIFPHLAIGILHGKLPPEEKVRVLQAFRENKLKLLVTTAVIEVGVDIPNATVMVIEGAEYFGLAQLHQFRGRIARSSHQAKCFLAPTKLDQASLRRLRALERINDGLKLAQLDLRWRGPGELHGVKQAGPWKLRIASLTNLPFIERTRRAAVRLLQEDPSLRSAPLLAARVSQLTRLQHSG